MWGWLRKNWMKVKDESIQKEVQKILDDEAIMKKRKDRLSDKFEKLMKKGDIIEEKTTEEDEVDDI